MLNKMTLKTFNPCWFSSLISLTSLDLYNNGITDIPMHSFSSLMSLKQINLGKNNLTTIYSDSFGTHPNLTTVYLQGNKINAIDRKFIDSTEITWINMDGNVCANDAFVNFEDGTSEILDGLQTCFDNFVAR